jgi:aminoglycoside phosphotransferase (APT) family kinase protein
VAIFSFITDGHPFAPVLDGFRERIAAEGPGPATGRAIVSSEIRARAADDGTFALDRFYCSLQRWPETGLPFAASSFYFAEKDGAARWCTFPDEPYLTSVQPYLAGRALLEERADLEVLRYVPLRRFTFRAPRRDGRPGREIGKFKRRSRLGESYERMQRVAGAVAASATGIEVPRPGGVEDAHSLYFQDAVGGVDLATRAARDPAALPAAAAVLAALHSVPCRGLPDVDEAAFHSVVARDLSWIAFHAPALASLAAAARGALADPPPIEAAVTCHGDFVASHVLDDAGRVTVIDLDLAHHGDPYREVAMLLASLPLDAPGAEVDEASIVAAYERRAGVTLDARRLAWHRVAAEAYYLALAFSKDRPADPGPLRSAVAALAGGS